MNKWNKKMLLALISPLLLAGCGSTSKVGGTATNTVDPNAVQIKMVHYKALKQQLTDTFQLADNSEAVQLLDSNQALFENVIDSGITKRTLITKIFIRACRDADPTILFSNPAAPSLQGIWNTLYPNDPAPESLKGGETAIRGLNLDNDSQLGTAFCILAATSLFNTAVNVSLE